MLVVTTLACALLVTGKPPSDAPIRLSSYGSTRGTAYEMSNKAVTRDGKLHVAWLDSVARCLIRTRDPRTGEWSAPVHLGDGPDNHAGPALTVDRAGYLHVLFGAHHHPLQYRRSVRPNDATEWTPTEPVGELLTYPSLVCGPDGTLHLTARGGPNPPVLAYHRKPPGEPWSARVTLVEPRIPPGYTQYGNSLAVDRSGRLHLALHVYDQHQRAAGKVAGYLRSADGGETWTRADGTVVQLPATRETIDVLESGPELDCRCGGMDVDGDGNPYLLVHHVSAPSTPTLWTHGGAGWRSVDLGPALRRARPGWFGAANGSVSFGADGTLYVALPVAPEPGAWGDPREEILLLVSRDRGATFTVHELPAVPGEGPIWHPSLERDTGWHPIDVPRLLFTRGGPGTTLTEDLRTSIYLLPLDGLAP